MRVVFVVVATALLSLSPGPSAAAGTCPLPPTLEGVAGHLLFRLTVDKDGQVTFVQPVYTIVEPASSLRPLTKELTRCLKRRRYDDLAVGGKWAADFPVYTSFHFFRRGAPDAPVVELGRGRRMPVDQIEEMRRQKLALAHRLLAGSSVKEAQGPGWILITDAGSETLAAAKKAIAAASRAFDAIFPGLPPIPGSSPVTVFMFSDADEFNQVAAFDNVVRPIGEPAGEYASWDRMVYMTASSDMPLPIVAGITAHEVTHHLVAQRLYGSQRRPPIWVTEGIAVLVECLRPPGPDGLDLGRFQRGKVFKGPFQWRASAEAYLEALRRASEGAGLPKLSVLFDEDWDVDSSLAYGMSWLLVHYLVNGDGGSHRAAFQRWLTSSDAGGGGASLAAALNMPLAAIDAALPAYVKSLQSRH
jgi:hypothetical protein